MHRNDVRRRAWLLIPALWFLVSMMGPSAGLAQTTSASPFGFPLPEGSYDPSIPTPDRVLGFAFGTRPLTPEEIYHYARALADASPRLLLVRYGTSVEGRPLLFLYAGTPEHLQRLDSLRAQWRRLALIEPAAGGDIESASQSLPLLVWFLYGVHGNEHSSSEAALTLAYFLAASQDSHVAEVLDQVVVALDLMQNPDGRARFVHHIRQSLGASPDPWRWAREHREPWPSGRYNHYLFDLNRDWLFLTQAETRARIAQYFRAPPQVVVDFHEMGGDASYYFAPPSEPVLSWLPNYVRRFWEIFGRANARAFEQRGWPYFFREVFDIFYPGYGDSFPTLNGAIGMTYEQASARGVVLRRKDGTLLRLIDAIEHHFTSGWTTLETAAKNREGLLRAFHDLHNRAAQQQKDHLWGWLIPDDNDPWLRSNLWNIFQRLHVRVQTPVHSFSLRVRDPYRKSGPATGEARPGDWMVPLDQAAGLVLRVWLAPDVPLDEGFLRRARERRTAGESPGFYDITAWSLPLAWGLKVYEIPRPVPDNRLQPAASPPAAPVENPPQASYAYLVCNDSLALYRMAGEALHRAYPFRVSRKPITIEKTTCPPGSLVFFVRRQPAGFATWIRSWQQHGMPTILALNTGWVEAGASLGSGAVEPVDHTRHQVLLTGPGTRASEVGALWYTLEQVYHWPLSRVNFRDLDRLDLSAVRVLLVPPLGATGDVSGPPENALDPLRNWLNQGGTLIAVGSAIRWAAHRGLLDLAKRKEPEETGAQEKLPPASVPGALLWAQGVHRHWLLAGSPTPTIAVLYRGRSLPQPNAQAARVAIRFRSERELRAAGFIWPDLKKTIAQSAFAWVQNRGKGRVIAIGQQPMFRGDFWGTHRVLLNALLFGSRIP